MSNRVSLIPGRHNFEVLFDQMIARGDIVLDPETMVEVTVEHDSWCGIHEENRYCDCHPTVTTTPMKIQFA